MSYRDSNFNDDNKSDNLSNLGSDSETEVESEINIDINQSDSDSEKSESDTEYDNITETENPPSTKNNFLSNSVIVDNDDRIIIPKLTKYERVRLLGDRAKQLSDGAKSMIRSEKANSAMNTAILELEHRVIPLKIIRTRPDGKIEIWSIKELEI